MSERPRDEKEEKDEKGRKESWDEKWRRDPLNAAMWALVLIWAGLVLIAENVGILDNLGIRAEAWPVIFIGAGVIVLLGVLVRLLVPAYRRPVTGSIIFGFILVGIGLGELTRWDVVGALVLIAIGVSIILSRFVGGQ
ncbi:MAG: hypothetical protein WBW48_09600 [Anaerolineae bacterium]